MDGKGGLLEALSVKDFKVLICKREEVKDFIEHYHYSKNINGLRSDYCFRLIGEDGNTIGACIYGKMAKKETLIT